MNRIQKLAQVYASHIALPWRKDAAPDQRLVFCVYSPSDERMLRHSLGEFEIATVNAGHAWHFHDLQGSFGAWLAPQKNAVKYFEKPSRLNSMALDFYRDWLLEDILNAFPANADSANTVLALAGLSGLFGFVKVKSLLERLMPRVEGRLAAFFPGAHEGTNYRLLDAYDGWNYHAIPLSADMYGR